MTPPFPCPTSPGIPATPSDDKDGKYNRNTSGATGSATMAPFCAPNLPELTFQGLIMNLMTHSWLPLVVKKVFEVSTAQTVVVPDCHTEFENEAGLVTVLSLLAQSEGIQDACQRSSAVDVFMVSLLTALEDLKHLPRDVHFPPLLRKTMFACWNLAHTAASSKTCDPSHQKIIEMPPRPPVARSSYVRPGLSADGRAVLEKWFRDHYENPYPTHNEKIALSRKCGVGFHQIQTFFFQKRRLFKVAAKSLPAVYFPSTDPSEPEPSIHLKMWRTEVLSKIPNINCVEFKRGVEQTSESIVDALFPNHMGSDISDVPTADSGFEVLPGENFSGGNHLQ